MNVLFNNKFFSTKLQKPIIFLFSLSGFYILDKFLNEDNSSDMNEKGKKYTYKNSLQYSHFNKIFEKKDAIIYNNDVKKYVNITTPFNRKIKYIYDLGFVYPEYENYNFNKLSDFFLNIHIFIN